MHKTKARIPQKAIEGRPYQTSTRTHGESDTALCILENRSLQERRGGAQFGDRCLCLGYNSSP